MLLTKPYTRVIRMSLIERRRPTRVSPAGHR